MLHAFLIIAFFVSLDLLWIKMVMKDLYMHSTSMILVTDSMGNVLVNTGPAIACYVVMIFALFYFVILPGKTLSALCLAKKGAILGICLYGTYALTCWALFQGFNAKLVGLDMLWGAILFSSTAFVAGKLMQCSQCAS